MVTKIISVNLVDVPSGLYLQANKAFSSLHQLLQGSANFFSKGQVVNIFGFVGNIHSLSHISFLLHLLPIVFFLLLLY